MGAAGAQVLLHIGRGEIATVPSAAEHGDKCPLPHLFIGENDILTGINITYTRNGAAAAPALRGKTLKATITIEYVVTTAGVDLNLGGPKVGTVLGSTMCGQYGTRKVSGTCLSIASIRRVGRVGCDRKTHRRNAVDRKVERRMEVDLRVFMSNLLVEGSFYSRLQLIKRRSRVIRDKSFGFRCELFVAKVAASAL